MLYRKMKRCDKELSILGFGCMRFPVLGDGHVDVPRSREMLRYAIDHGVNYVDTAYPYHNGESEVVVGLALKDGYREKVRLATKLPPWLVTSRQDMDRILNEQLTRLQTDQIDFYLIHAVDSLNWDRLDSLGIRDFLGDAIADGRIGHAGFSSHDSLDGFKHVVDSYDWDLCQIQYNLLDENYQVGKAGLEYAAAKGLDIIIMEPLRGGMLTRDVPEIARLWANTGNVGSPAEHYLRWVWNHPEVTVVLSGMTDMAHVVENVQIADTAMPCSLTAPELELFEQAKSLYRSRIKVGCTGCKYCMPCPSHVSIPECFNMYNTAHMFDAADYAKWFYGISVFLGDNGCASKCTECGECEEKCPQHLPIREDLREVQAYFGK